MMVLRVGEPSGKAGSLCKRFLRAFIWLFTSVCNMWVRIRRFNRGMKNRSLLGAWAVGLLHCVVDGAILWTWTINTNDTTYTWSCTISFGAPNDGARCSLGQLKH